MSIACTHIDNMQLSDRVLLTLTLHDIELVKLR